MSAELTRGLHELEVVIEEGLSTFVEVGNALMEIRDGKLYKRTHKTFEAYCKDRWLMTKVQGHRLINAAQVVGNLKSNQLVTPQSESVARPLAALPPVAQAEAWSEAVEESGGGNPTAEQVKRAVDRKAFKESSIAAGIEAAKDSTTLWKLKSLWKKASAKDRRQFAVWMETQNKTT